MSFVYFWGVNYFILCIPIPKLFICSLKLFYLFDMEFEFLILNELNFYVSNIPPSADWVFKALNSSTALLFSIFKLLSYNNKSSVLVFRKDFYICDFYLSFNTSKGFDCSTFDMYFYFELIFIFIIFSSSLSDWIPSIFLKFSFAFYIVWYLWWLSRSWVYLLWALALLHLFMGLDLVLHWEGSMLL